MTNGNGTTFFTRKLKDTSLYVLVAQEQGCVDRIEFSSGEDDAEAQLAGVMSYLAAQEAVGEPIEA